MVRALIATALLSASAGCKQNVDLGAVRDMAAAATSTRDTLDSVAEDYYESCVRRNTYATIATRMDAYMPFVGKAIPFAPPPQMPAYAGITNDDLERQAVTALAPRVAAVAAQLSPPQIELMLARPDAIALTEQLGAKTLNVFSATISRSSPDTLSHVCDKAKAAAQAWQDANAVLIGYFVALGNLAGQAPGSDPYHAHALATNLQKADVLTSAQATAVGNLANTVIQNVYDAKRRNALATVVDTSDQSVADAIDFIESIATRHYRTILQLEQETSDDFLRENLQLARPGAQAFEVLQFADAWSARDAAMAERVGAITSYVNALEKLKHSHRAILQAIDKDDADSALAVAQFYYSALQPDVAAMQKAFGEKKGHER